MNTLNAFLFSLVCVATVTVTSDMQAQGRLTINIKHHFGDKVLKLDQEYATLLGKQITLTRFKYYLSHIELTRNDGTVWKEEKSYHFFELSDETTNEFRIALDGVPPGDYSTLSFSVGLDSTVNHSGNQEGVLDPDYGMFWMWETGYTFFKIEGFFKENQDHKNAMVIHVGRDDCLRKIVLDFQPLHLYASQASELVDVTADVSKIFGGYPSSVIDPMPSGTSGISIMGGDKAGKMATNFSQIFSIRE